MKRWRERRIKKERQTDRVGRDGERQTKKERQTDRVGRDEEDSRLTSGR